MPLSAQAQEIGTLSVMVDQKLALPMAEIARAYGRQAHLAVGLSFISVQDDIGVMTEGAAADVLVTAHAGNIETLAQQGLVDVKSRKAVARNQLVLAGPDGSGLKVSLAQGFPVAPLINAMQGQSLLVIGNPETLEEGAPAREALRRMEVDADMEPYVIYLKQFPQIIRLMTLQNAYAILYISDATRYRDIKIIDRFPAQTYHPVTYEAAALAGTRMEQARQFIRYLGDAQAQSVFGKYGIALK